MAGRLKLDRFLPYRLNVLASRVSRQLGQAYGARFGISIAEWRVIAHLAEADRISVREICRRVDLDKSKVSRAVASLEASGLVEKKVSAVDRRLVELRLTGKGRRLFAEIEPLALAYEAALVTALTADERRALRRIIEKLTSAAEVADRP